MKLLKVFVYAIVIGVVLALVANQFASSKYPSCDLVVKGIGVSTFTCMNANNKNQPCQNLSPNGLAMTQCVNSNYYTYKTFPFGFKQKLGSDSNLNDLKPKHQNEIATFALGFVVSSVILIPLSLRNTRQQAKEPDNQVE